VGSTSKSQAQEETEEEGRPVTVHFRGRHASEQTHRLQPGESIAELIQRLYEDAKAAAGFREDLR
jgi:hypothetical protein